MFSLTNELRMHLVEIVLLYSRVSSPIRKGIMGEYMGETTQLQKHILIQLLTFRSVNVCKYIEKQLKGIYNLIMRN